MTKNWLRFSRMALLLAVSVLPSWGLPQSSTDPLNRPALMVRRPAETVLMDVARSRGRLIAVGEHGIVIVSDDEGKRWRQVAVPVSVTLTGVSFASESDVWVVGHSGVVLKSEDGGETWIRHLDGSMVAKIALDAAQAENAVGTAASKRLKAAQQLVKDGPDKPFFAVHFDDSKHGFIVGGYGLILHTTDGGSTWLAWSSHVDNPKNLSIYAIRKVQGNHYLAGEQGLFCRANKESVEFECLPTPFEGSYFALSAGPHDEVIVSGLLGNTFVSSDRGDHWKRLSLGNGASLASIALNEEGRIIFGSQRGEMFGGYTLAELQPLPLLSKPITSMIDTPSGGLVIVGPFGLQVIPALKVRLEKEMVSK